MRFMIFALLLSCDVRSLSDDATDGAADGAVAADVASDACDASPSCVAALARFCECCPDPGQRCAQACFARILDGWTMGACDAYAEQTCDELRESGQCGGANGPMP